MHCSPRRYRPFAALLCCVLAGCGADHSSPLEIVGATMGTRYSVQVVPAAARLDDDTLGREIDAALARINAQLSTYDPQAELSRFNANPSTDWVAISPALHDVVAEALRVSRATQGAFDVTVGPAVNLWGFGPAVTAPRVPSTERIDDARTRIGYTRLALRDAPPALSKDQSDVYVDLSAIAKGYAVDQLAALLEARGIDRYLIEIGGELRARGRSARGDPWRVAVERPLANQRSVLRVLPVHDTGMATSGNYRNFFELDGQRYAHTIDPRTARPVDHTLASVTVLHPSAMTADALATAMSVLGTRASLALAERDNIAALFIDHDGETLVQTTTSAFDAQLPAT